MSPSRILASSCRPATIRARVVGGRVTRCLLIGFVANGCGAELAESPADMQLESLPVIGGEIDGPSAFGEVGDVEMDGQGRVYVLDRMAGSIQVYEASGEHVTTMGTQGDGPGELQSPTAMGWGPQGRLWVVDARNGRYVVFDRDGGLVETLPRPIGGMAGNWPVTFTSDGRLFDVAFELGPGGPSAVPVELDISGGPVREVGTVELPPNGPWGLSGEEVRQDGQIFLIEVPYAPMQVWQIGPRGELWYGNTGTYEVHRRSGDGTETVFSGRVAAPPVTDSERQTALEENEGLDPAMLLTTKPPVRGFFVGESGDLWVLLRSDAPETEARIDVFDSLGVHLATFDAPLAAQPRPKVRDGVVIGVARDELGVERIVRYRIP